MSLFQISWIVSCLVLLLLAMAIGKQTTNRLLGILIDGRGRYSLTHFQIVVWTLVILSSAIGVLIADGFNPTNFGFSPQLLGLMGISAGSAVLATSVKGSKDAPGSTANVARAGTFTLSDNTTTTITPHFAQIWLEEEGDQADKVVDITKYQNFIFTLVVVGFYVTIAWNTGGLPVLPDNVVWLVGISHAGYVGAKVPNKT
ncbi:MAG: hypothetical protein KDI62_28065 [Anaerolineae bacterium]|nr:hypothetical protein [Anaerolineae bacterium]MCB9109034.1 hypothetical protein [Anaerolineales bacterium]